VYNPLRGAINNSSAGLFANNKRNTQLTSAAAEEVLDYSKAQVPTATAKGMHL